MNKCKEEDAFTLIELLVVLFILTSISFVAVPHFLGLVTEKSPNNIGNYLKALRDEAVTTKKQTFFKIDFKNRYFAFKGAKGEKILRMLEEDTWQIYLPSRGNIQEGEVTVIFPPTVSEEFIALYLTRGNNDYTIILNNLSGEVEIEEGKKSFSE